MAQPDVEARKTLSNEGKDGKSPLQFRPGTDLAEIKFELKSGPVAGGAGYSGHCVETQYVPQAWRLDGRDPGRACGVT